ncbi:peptidase M16 [Spirochaetia bacterium]|nr:peptidase M16 [Spirochaetia bacterium]
MKQMHVFTIHRAVRMAGRAIAGLSLAFVLAMGILSCTSSGGRNDIYGGLGKGSDPVPFMTNARRGTLPNGLRYYILENARPENRAFLTLAVNAGSVLETEEERGLAHFTEHMAFNGTTRFPELELLNYLRSLGMRFGPDVNAYTSFDETVFGIEVPTEVGANGLKRIPDNALAVIDDWTYAVTFAPSDVDDERAVILEEHRSRLGAGDRVQNQLYPQLFAGSRYAARLPIGLPEIIQTAPASRLENFYKTWYRPDNMAIILVGDFDGAALEAELTSHFTAPAATGNLDRPVYELPPPKKGNIQAIIITDPESPYTQINTYYKGTPRPLQGDLASYRQGIIDTLISRMISDRFDEALLIPETPYVAAGAWGDRYGRESNYYILAVIAKPGSTRDSLRALLREKESLERYGFTASEIDRAKRALVSDVMRQVSEKDRQESNRYINEFTNHFLTSLNVADIEWELDAITKLLPGIRDKEISDAVKGYLAANDLTVTITAPDAEAATLPSPDEITRLVQASRRERIERPRDRPVTGELLDRSPQPGAILGEGLDEETGAILWQLSNGAIVILKETANKNNEIILYSVARGGITSVDTADTISASLASELASNSGIGPYSRTELLQKLADKQVGYSFWTASFTRGFQGSATAGDLKTLFELIYLGFTEPRIDPAVVSVLLDQYRTVLAQRSENPEAVFSDEITRIATGNNPYFKPMELADLEKVDTRAAMDFINRALNPADYLFVFTGNLDLPVLRSYVETYLASVPPRESWDAWTDPRIVRPGKVDQQVYKGREERSLVFMSWFEPRAYTESLGAAASVLTEYLDIVLTEEIREKLGGVYSVSIDASLSPLPPDGELVMQSVFVCDPNRATELSNAVIRQIELIAQGTINQDTFIKAKEAVQKAFEESIQSNSYIANSYASLAAILDLPLGQMNQRPALYGAVIPAEIQDICRRLLPRGPARIILYPEGWTE